MAGFSKLAGQVRRRFVEAPDSIGARRRADRWREFERSFPEIAQMDVVDLGGTADSWRRAPVRPRSVTVLNMFEPGEAGEPWIRTIMGDACDARSALSAAGVDIEHDLVFSNSVIEHVGGHAKRLEFAAEVHALAPRHWVQTPYRYFPIEPHWLFPMLQFIPIAPRARLAKKWPLAHSRPDGDEQAMSEVQWTELLGHAELQAYFPKSTIRHERALMLTKSLIAVGGTRGG